VKPAAMDEQGGEHGEDGVGGVAVPQVLQKIPGDEAKEPEEFLQVGPHGHFPKKYQGIYDDDGVVEGGDALRGNAVSQWDHEAFSTPGLQLLGLSYARRGLTASVTWKKVGEKSGGKSGAVAKEALARQL
jgi:hypothetical protein